jgi:heme/copper-type cytochrome/quinol oxidase subunit 4
MTNEPTEHVTTTEARGASTPHVTRYVLGFGLAIIIVVFGLLFLLGSR